MKINNLIIANKCKINDKFVTLGEAFKAGPEQLQVTQVDVAVNNDALVNSLRAYNNISNKHGLYKIKNKEIIDILKHNVECYGLEISFLLELDDELSKLKDVNIKNVILNHIEEYDKMMKRFSPIDYYEDGDEVQLLLNVVKTSNGNSCNLGEYYPSCPHYVVSYYNYLKENRPELFDRVNLELSKMFSDSQSNSMKNNLQNANVIAQDFLNEQKFYDLMEYITYMGFANEDFKNYLYEEYYLNKVDFDASIKDQCRFINKKFNTKIFLSAEQNMPEKLEQIKEELSDWKKVSNGLAVMPSVINLSWIDIEYFSTTIGKAAKDTKKISLKPNSDITQVLRHELMHLNDYLPKPHMLTESIIKTKIVVDKNGKPIEVIDFKNCLYREELLKAGINLGSIRYAYSNIREFLAVAAEGDTSKYSEEFKNILVTLGMPEYLFNLPVKSRSLKNNSQVIEKVLRKNPNIKSFENIINNVNKYNLI